MPWLVFLRATLRGDRETHPAASLLHVRWLVDPARRGRVSPLQRASDTGTLAAWLDKRLSEEASGPVGRFRDCRWRNYDADADADLGAADADDPLAQLRRDIGGARGSSARSRIPDGRVADSPASAPRKDFVVQRFGAAPGRDLVELRSRVCLDIGSACGCPARAPGRLYLRAGDARIVARNLSRHRWTVCVVGSNRRVAAQLGVEVAFDTATLGGRDLLARGATFRRLAGKEGGLSIADARAAAGI